MTERYPNGGAPEIADLGFARLDLQRAARTGDPEVVFGTGKTPGQIVAVLRALHHAHPGNAVLATRLSDEAIAQCRTELPDADVDEVARVAVLGEARPPRGRVAVVGAGTADLPVIRECAATVRVFGSVPDVIVDVGVAGPDPPLAQGDRLARGRAGGAGAGMEAALPSVLGGLVGAPLIAVPTSIGYGWHMEGLTAWLATLNSCAPGVVTVNVDNGFGAGVAAARIARATA
ncbi:nickel pincer cofactor biosynthesis protein LarB [Micromonospora sp. CPCC 205371]|nr:nickel pincer cofactor biosynthesis protein LarB [Micromonospora sp. CPCC 205371]